MRTIRLPLTALLLGGCATTAAAGGRPVGAADEVPSETGMPEEGTEPDAGSAEAAVREGVEARDCVMLHVHVNDAGAQALKERMTSRYRLSPQSSVEVSDHVRIVARPDDLRTYRMVERRVIQTVHPEDEVRVHESESRLITTWTYEDIPAVAAAIGGAPPMP